VSNIQDTAYPRLKSNLSAKELAAIYTPTHEEQSLAKQVTKGRVAKLGFLILLKIFQRLGYAVPITSVPASVIQHITSVAQLSASFQELAKYDASGTRKRHLSAIRAYLRLQAYGQSAQQVMFQAMQASARTKHDLADLINVAIEELVRQRFELPAFSTMVRAARKVRTDITDAFYQQITKALSREERMKINALFVADSTIASTPWNQLKQEPGKPMLTHLQELVKRLRWLSNLQVGKAVLAAIPEVKVKHFAEEARTLDVARMKELDSKKRYTLSSALLSVQYACSLDDIAEMFVKRMQQLHHKAKEGRCCIKSMS
jgi:DNA integrity scanning protein DisA with diadenylate cyclase activity